MTDVDAQNPRNGNVLIYDDTDQKWENHDLTAGSNIEIVNGAGSITISSTGGPESLNDLNDVDLGSLFPGQILIYDSSTGDFVNAAITAGQNITITNSDGSIVIDSAAFPEDLSDLNDVSIQNAQSGNVLIYDDSQADWVNAFLTSGSNIAITNSDGSVEISATGIPSQLNDLSDVSISSESNGELLIYNASVGDWVNNTLTAGQNITITNAAGQVTIDSTGFPEDLDDLGDVNISLPSAGDVLIYDATALDWVNAKITAGSGINVTNGDGSVTISSSSTSAMPLVTQYESPSSTGFTIQVDGAPSSVISNIWLLVTPAAAYASGTIVFPSLADRQNHQEITINYTKQVNSITFNGNGATIISSPASFSADSSVKYRYDELNTTWYKI